MSTWSLTYRKSVFKWQELQTFLRVLPTRWRRYGTKLCQCHPMYIRPGVKLWGIPSDLRSSTSYLRSSTSNDRSCTWQSRSSTFAGQNSSIKQYLNSTKAKQSHLNARKPLSAVGKPTFALGPSGSSFGPSGRAPTGIHHLLLRNLTTACC